MGRKKLFLYLEIQISDYKNTSYTMRKTVKSSPLLLYLNLLWTQDTGHPSVWGLLFMMISFLLTQFNIRFTSSNGWKNRSSIHLTAEFLGFFWVFKSLSENFSLTFCLNKNITVVWGLVNLFLSPTESLSYPLSWVCLSLQGALS